MPNHSTRRGRRRGTGVTTFEQIAIPAGRGIEELRQSLSESFTRIFDDENGTLECRGGDSDNNEAVVTFKCVAGSSIPSLRVIRLNVEIPGRALVKGDRVGLNVQCTSCRETNFTHVVNGLTGMPSEFFRSYRMLVTGLCDGCAFPCAFCGLRIGNNSNDSLIVGRENRRAKVHLTCIPACVVCHESYSPEDYFGSARYNGRSRGPLQAQFTTCNICALRCPLCRDGMREDLGASVCEGCSEKTYRSMKTKHGYSGNVPRILGCETAHSPDGVYYGAEVELLSSNAARVKSMLWRMQFGTAWRGDWGRVTTCKDDGSLPPNGYEVVTIPLRPFEMRKAFLTFFCETQFRGRMSVTDEWRKKREADISKAVQDYDANPALAEAIGLPRGFSFTRSGGNHFHVSGLSNETKAALWFLLATPSMKFIHYLGFGRRSDNYASLERMLVSDRASRLDIARRMGRYTRSLNSDSDINGVGYSVLGERYRAMTFYSRIDTVEFRGFKTPETFGEALKNVDYLNLLVAFAMRNKNSYSNIGRPQFLAFLKENVTAFPHLAHYLANPTRWERVKSHLSDSISRSERHPAFTANHTSTFGPGNAWSENNPFLPYVTSDAQVTSLQDATSLIPDAREQVIRRGESVTREDVSEDEEPYQGFDEAETPGFDSSLEYSDPDAGTMPWDIQNDCHCDRCHQARRAATANALAQ